MSNRVVVEMTPDGQFTVSVDASGRRPVAALGPRPEPDQMAAPDDLILGGVRTEPLPALVAVTDSTQLAANIGLAEARLVVRMLRAHATDVVDAAVGAEAATSLLDRVRDSLASHPAASVLIVGGYDVVPSLAVNTVPYDIGRRVVGLGDSDDWIVWTDDPYGESSDQTHPSVPVSRVPDGHSAQFLLFALQADIIRNDAAGVRNLRRPFVEHVAPEIEFKISEPFTSADFHASINRAGRLYLMLHGSAVDPSRFWGEDNTATSVEACTVETVATLDAAGATVFAAACWGALTVDRRARDTVRRPGAPLGIRTPGQSVALQFLARGANAFVGCTGSHWSPTGNTGYSRVLHQTFWDETRAGVTPAVALHRAKQATAQHLGTLTDPSEIAIVAKTLQQFTCLGLGH